MLLLLPVILLSIHYLEPSKEPWSTGVKEQGVE